MFMDSYYRLDWIEAAFLEWLEEKNFHEGRTEDIANFNITNWLQIKKKLNKYKEEHHGKQE